MRQYIRIAALIAIAAFVPSAPLLAQISGSLNGTVDDDGGAPVAGAAVSIAGAVRETTKTDARGTFAFTGLP
ncbi:MAG TPA: carboxypeptidase-like regulatory domain-containing protein, partial [Candidatus Tumulicola sp.]